ncbi:hypothetical protein Cgig2_020375 [Carnegiea gigantea]|uniref:Phytocyanin domain-containing protein n=1 Tax=Carnegiea gigantea TaxID=171969 RepID=A0A9Q1JPJ3_9CARY|nr:hypothetical protein Cgig2_020375 [Carnegiea gigantea]
MGVFSARKACKFAPIFSLLYIFSTTIHVSCFQYEVGGKRGWIRPDGSEYETYNEWAQQHRFHVGDTLCTFNHFKYSNDSVLLVNNEDYTECAVNNPISKFEDGNTVFEFDHSGFYYFISGQPGHCQAGQKMIIWVMGAHHQSAISAPSPSPRGPTISQDGSEGRNADSWGPSQTNSTDTMPITSILLNLFMGVVIVLYLLMD